MVVEIYKKSNVYVHELLTKKEKKSKKLASLVNKFDQELATHNWKTLYILFKYVVLILLVNYVFDWFPIFIFSGFFLFRIMEKLIQSYEKFLSDYKPWTVKQNKKNFQY